MSFPLYSEQPPLEFDADGSCRVAGARVTLRVLLSAFEQGASAEEIAEAFPSVPLADVYAVIAYYLRHRDQLDEYIAGIITREDENIRRMNSTSPWKGIREELLARRHPVAR